MADHGLEREPEQRIFTEIADLKRQIQELRTLQKVGITALNIRRSSVLTQNIVLGAGSSGYFNVLLTNYATLDVFADLDYDFYEDVVDDAHQVGTTLNVFQSHWTFRVWRQLHLSDDEHICVTVWARNDDSSGHTLYWKVQSRFLANPSP